MRLIDADALMGLLKAWQYEAQRLGAEINNRFATAIIAQVNAMPTIEPDQKWIPCSERLPEENEVVLTQAQFKDDVKMAVSSRVDFNYWTGWGTREINIVAWMPLPEPYKENQDV